MDAKKQRQARIAQNKHRGSKRSYKTELETAQILLAWESEQLSEGQVSRALDLDRVTVRMLREGAILSGMTLCAALLPVDTRR